MVILKIFLKSPKIFSAGQSFAGEKAPDSKGESRTAPVRLFQCVESGAAGGSPDTRSGEKATSGVYAA